MGTNASNQEEPRPSRQALVELWRDSLPGDPAACDLRATLRPSPAAEPPGGTLSGRTLGAGTLSGATCPGEGDGAGESSTPPTAVLRGADSAYVLLDEIGRGGMGVIHRARQAGLERVVAIKRSLPGTATPGLEARFVAEARVTGALDHPNIVPVHELGRSPEGEVFLSMKLVGGTSWARLIHPEGGGKVPVARGDELDRHLGILISVCNAVAFAHARGIVHRDLKPENVMVGDFGEILVMDWGIALDVGEQPSAASHAMHRSQVRAPAGTPHYLAPEMAEARGQDIGPWTDVYLLGGILHELLTGHPPHRGRDLPAVLIAASRALPPDLPEDVPPGLADICRRALARDPRDRYRDAGGFRDALQDHLRHRESERVSAAASAILARCPTQTPSDDAARAGLYGAYAEAVAGFAQAQILWSGNQAAARGERSARLAYAQAALAGGDLGLADAQLARLPADDRSVKAVGGYIAQAKEARQRSVRNARRMRTALTWTVLAILVGLGAGYLVVVAEQRRTVAALAAVTREQAMTLAEKDAKEAARLEAEQQRALAVVNAARAATSARIAEAEAQRANAAAETARTQADRADSEARRARMEAWRGRVELAKVMYEKGLAEGEKGHPYDRAAFLLAALELAPRNLAPEGYQPPIGDSAWADFAWRAYAVGNSRGGGIGGFFTSALIYDVAYAQDRILYATGKQVVLALPRPVTARQAVWPGQGTAVAATADGSTLAIGRLGQPLVLADSRGLTQGEIPIEGNACRLALDARGTLLAALCLPKVEPDAAWVQPGAERPYTLSIWRLPQRSLVFSQKLTGPEASLLAFRSGRLFVQVGRRLQVFGTAPFALLGGRDLEASDRIAITPEGMLLCCRPGPQGTTVRLEDPLKPGSVVGQAMELATGEPPQVVGCGEQGRALLVAGNRFFSIDWRRRALIAVIPIPQLDHVRQIQVAPSGTEAVSLTGARGNLPGLFFVRMDGAEGSQARVLQGLASDGRLVWDPAAPVDRGLTLLGTVPSPDGRWLVVSTTDAKGQVSLHLIQRVTGKRTGLFHLPPDNPGRLLPWIDVAPDGGLVFCALSNRPGERAVFADGGNLVFYSDEMPPGKVEPGTKITTRKGRPLDTDAVFLVANSSRGGAVVELAHNSRKPFYTQVASIPQVVNQDGASLVFPFNAGFNRLTNQGFEQVLDLVGSESGEVVVASPGRGHLAVFGPQSIAWCQILPSSAARPTLMSDPLDPISTMPRVPGAIGSPWLPGAFPAPHPFPQPGLPANPNWLESAALPRIEGAIASLGLITLPSLNAFDITDVALSWSGSRLLISQRREGLYLVDLPTKQVLWQRPAQTWQSMAISPDDQFVAAWDGSLPGVRILDLLTGRELWQVRFPAAPAPGSRARLAFSPDGKTILASWAGGCGEWTLRHATLGEPPALHPEEPDPLREFRTYYRQVGYRIMQSGPTAGQTVSYEEPAEGK